MLQQTQAARVEPIFEAFMLSFPDPASLGVATVGDALRAWAGLGYHRRARALHAAARVIVDEHRGSVPTDVRSLRSLPGVGPYTAAAVASIAFRAPVAAVDTNVRRIVARVHFGVDPDEMDGGLVCATAGAWLDPEDPGRWNEALMDLGRERCRPAPRCSGCPLQQWCRFAASGRVGRSSGRKQPPFEGSSRQTRGVVVAVLRSSTAAATLPQLAQLTGIAPDRVAAAVAGLLADGLVERTRADRIRLPR
jgi:A/G-specific adenine glycosylase